MGLEGQQQCRAFVDDADSRVSVAMNTAFVASGLSKPAFQLYVVPRQVRLLASDKQARSKVRHHVAHVVLDRVGTALELRLQRLKLCLSLRARAPGRVKGGLDGPYLRHLVAHLFLGSLHTAQPPVDVAGQTGESLMRRPPFWTSRFRWRDVRTSPRASAMRMPGGCSGPP